VLLYCLFVLFFKTHYCFYHYLVNNDFQIIRLATPLLLLLLLLLLRVVCLSVCLCLRRSVSSN